MQPTILELEKNAETRRVEKGKILGAVEMYIYFHNKVLYLYIWSACSIWYMELIMYVPQKNRYYRLFKNKIVPKR